MTDIRDTDQPENGNDESENPGVDTRETDPNEVKTSGTIEKAERDAY